MRIYMYMYICICIIYTLVYIYICIFIFVYIYIAREWERGRDIERERERETDRERERDIDIYRERENKGAGNKPASLVLTERFVHNCFCWFSTTASVFQKWSIACIKSATIAGVDWIVRSTVHWQYRQILDKDWPRLTKH